MTPQLIYTLVEPVFHPHLFGDYIIVDRIAIGGMAEVFKAHATAMLSAINGSPSKGSSLTWGKMRRWCACFNTRLKSPLESSIRMSSVFLIGPSGR